MLNYLWLMKLSKICIKSKFNQMISIKEGSELFVDLNVFFVVCLVFVFRKPLKIKYSNKSRKPHIW